MSSVLSWFTPQQENKKRKQMTQSSQNKQVDQKLFATDQKRRRRQVKFIEIFFIYSFFVK
jgi:hypothetical protein